MRFSRPEIMQILKSWAIVSLAFGIVLNGGYRGLTNLLPLIISIVMSAITVGVGFILHELAHKFFAQKYGAWAEFRAFDRYLYLGLLFSLMGFIFILPGAVFIRGHISTMRYGIISVAGPIMNIIVGLFFFALALVLPTGFLQVGAVYGAQINFFLAVFNMLPFWQIDGAKVWRWNKAVFALVMIAAVLCTTGSWIFL